MASQVFDEPGPPGAFDARMAPGEPGVVQGDPGEEGGATAQERRAAAKPMTLILDERVTRIGKEERRRAGFTFK
ncbi:hypothetical protein A176_000741 [Myxococcus hansupus]|uniref:Uncharacterized protein n=1 Tax=Pseudomyxococcus hansupus TaxID=1297742 RepID=A0A0H4WM47_9BACT|nr:hypothetical protein A176_000741 [Myxococcus hansupus]